MCTAVSYINNDHFFGRNLDLEHWFSEAVTVTPRNYEYHFRMLPSVRNHFAMIGIASVVNNYPLYYEATNERGLSMAGLNFPGNAVYFPENTKKINLAPYELIPWLLGKYSTVEEVRAALENINITAIPFSDTLPLSPLHWMISDSSCSIVLESTADGIYVYDNPVNILTNNPPFAFHLQNLANYLNVTAEEPENRFADSLKLNPYSRGMGGLGLPGDLSSASRFIRAAFTLHNSVADATEDANICQFFHILDAVALQRGCVKIGSHYEETLYSSCCNTKKGIYYYKTYDNSTVTAVNMFHCDLSGDQIISFPLKKKLSILFEN